MERGIILHHASLRLACANVRASRAASETIAAFVAGMYRALDGRIVNRIAREGVCFTGGGALLRGLHRALAQRLRLRLNVPADPMRVVISGARRLLDGEAAHLWGGFAESWFVGGGSGANADVSSI